MDIAIFKEAQEAYERGEYAAALVGFTACSRQVGELSQAETCKFYHLIGNCYIKSGMAAKAAEFYNKALEISTPDRKPSLLVNLGTAYLSMDDATQALHAFKQALNWPGYATPYKALSGIGAVELKAGHMQAAGNAYRAAALDPANPSPGKSLVNLGVCFMELGRSEDAVVSYETALDLGLSTAGTNKCKANLAQAYLAQGRVSDALAAFEEATADGTYQLSKVAAHDMTMARSLKDRFGDYLGASAEEEEGPAEQGQSAPDAGAAATMTLDSVELQDPDPSESGVDPFEPKTQPAASQPSAADEAKPAELDPSAAETQVFPVVGAEPAAQEEPVAQIPALQPDQQQEDGGALIPSPEDTAFFSVSEEQIDKEAKEERRKARKGRVGLKVALVIVVLLLIAAAAGVVLYVKGYGYPLQETVAQEFLQAATNDQSTDVYWDSSVAQESRDSQMAVLEDVTNTQVIAVERSITSSTVYASGVLKDGGTVYFQIAMGRDLVSWNVQFVELYFPSAAQ